MPQKTGEVKTRRLTRTRPEAGSGQGFSDWEFARGTAPTTAPFARLRFHVRMSSHLKQQRVRPGPQGSAAKLKSQAVIFIPDAEPVPASRRRRANRDRAMPRKWDRAPDSPTN